MGYNLELSSAGKLVQATDLSTNAGYSELCDWIDSLSDDFPSLAKLAETGEYEGTDELAVELNQAIESNPPEDPDTLSVANRLADLLGAGHPAETARITA